MTNDSIYTRSKLLYASLNNEHGLFPFTSIRTPYTDTVLSAGFFGDNTANLQISPPPDSYAPHAAPLHSNLPLFIIQDGTVSPNTHCSSTLTKRPFEWVHYNDKKNPLPSGEERPRKKAAPRADKACERCRKGKKRCDGYPHCKACKSKGINCFSAGQNGTSLSSLEMSDEQQLQAEISSEHSECDDTDRQIKITSSLLEQVAVPIAPTAQSQQIPDPRPNASAVVEKYPNESRTSLVAMLPQEHGCGTAAGFQGTNTSPAVCDDIAVLQQQKYIRAVRIRCHFDENLLGIAKSDILDPIRLNFGCDFADAVTMAGKLLDIL